VRRKSRKGEKEGECVRKKRWKGGEGGGMCEEEEVEEEEEGLKTFSNSHLDATCRKISTETNNSRHFRKIIILSLLDLERAGSLTLQKY
jgi:hypothetical protein